MTKYTLKSLINEVLVQSSVISPYTDNSVSDFWLFVLYANIPFFILRMIMFKIRVLNRMWRWGQAES
jgi:hypothetical protein